MATLAERINDSLQSLRGRAPDILGSAVLSTEGFVVSSLLPADVDQELLSRMAASLFEVGVQVTSDLMGAAMEQVYVRSPKGYVVLNALTRDTALVLLLSRDAKLGLVFLELERALADLKKAM